MTTAAVVKHVNPFPGIVPFDEKDAWSFFGRDSEIEEILDRLSGRRLVAVIGVSGCGKSSLVRAGVVPVLRLGAAQNLSGRWRIHTITPANDPLAALRASLQTPPNWPTTSFELVTHAQQTLQPNEKLLLIVDQFEELFRFRAETQSKDAGNQADLFANLLLNAIDQRDVPIYILLTMRSDFLGDCAQFRGLPEALNNAYYLVPRMTRAQQQEAIERPLAEQNLNIAPALVQRLLNDSAEDPDQLPILQHLLKRLWENHAARSTIEPIDSTDYQSVGGWQNALDNDADRIVDHFKEHETKIARLFKWITAPGPNGKPIRRPRPYDECIRACQLDPDLAGDIVSAFEERGLLRRGADSQSAGFRLIGTLAPRATREKSDLVDLPHESMIRQWTRLNQWTVEEEESASVYRRLAEAVRKNRPLYRDPDLAEALLWQKQQNPHQSWAARYEDAAVFPKAMGFLRRIEGRRRLLRMALAVGLLAVVAAAILFYCLYLRAELQRHIANSRGIAAAAALARGSQPDLALILGLEAYQAAPTYEARNTILTGIQSSRYLLSYLYDHGPAYSVAFSPDGKTLASASGDMKVQLWDVATRSTLGPPLKGLQSRVTSVAFSPDGKTLATAGEDFKVQLWDQASRKTLGGPLIGHTSTITSIAFSPDGKTLISGSFDKTVRVWDVASRSPSGNPLLGHTSVVMSVAFSADGRMIASASSDSTVRLWDVATQRPLGSPILGHTSAVTSVGFSPDGKILASAGDDKTIRLWDPASRRALAAPIAVDVENHVTFSPDSKTLASGGASGVVWLWNVATRKLLSERLTGHTSFISSLAFSPDGKTLASASLDTTVRIWDVRESGSLGELLQGHSNAVMSIAFSPDSETLVSASADSTVRLWDAIARRPLGKALSGHTGQVFSVAFNPDGKTFASAGADKTVRLWDKANHRPLGQPLSGHTAAVSSVAFSNDGETLASASADKTVRLWDVATHEPLGKPLVGHTDTVMSVMFSPTAKILASASLDKTVRLWDMATHRQLGAPLRVSTAAVYSLAFSQDGEILASAGDDDMVQLWDVAKRRALGEPLSVHRSYVTSIMFSPDRKTLVSTGADGTVRLWDFATHRLLGGPLVEQSAPLYSVSFSPDGRLLASASIDGTIRLWDVGPSSWISHTCSIVNRNLSLAEWHQYLGTDVPYRKTCPALPPGDGAPLDNPKP